MLAFLITLFATTAAMSADVQPVVRLHSAGSLRAAMTDMAAAYVQTYGVSVEPVYGPSGAMTERLAKGEPGEVFTSADMGYPQTLTAAGMSGPTVLFARNHLCAILRPGFSVTPQTLLTTLLRTDVKVGTSSPDNDPGGAYAWAMFKKADGLKAGASATLEAKTIKTGNQPGMLSAPPNTNNALLWFFQEKKLDAFISYCTSGHAAAEQLSGISTVELPQELAVSADYGLTVLKRATPQAMQFAFFILSPAGQKILADHGFDAPLLP